MILAAVSFVAGIYFLPVGRLIVDWFDDTVLYWWYNRPRR
jgi:hypothetical protein